jgi:glycosyltransferase involved in cell wall biosynthesis
MSRPNVLVLRGASVNPWDLRPLELLDEEFAVRALVPHGNTFETNEIGVETATIRTRDRFAPPGPVRETAKIAPINRALGAEPHFEWADIVHSAELGTWFTAQAAEAKRRHGFKLVLTVWETIPFAATFRNRFSAANRKLALASADLLLPTTQRARDALLLEGADPERLVVVPPGIELEAFRPAAGQPRPRDPVLISPGRLVWEKGHQDVIRAIAALAGGVVEMPGQRPVPRLLIVGQGPEEAKLRAYADELGVGDRVELRGGVSYSQMAGEYHRAGAMVLASLPVPRWEEQFGMVLVEAMASGLPVIASASGAIPEVVGDAGRLFEPGDWLGLARLIAEVDLVNGVPELAAQRERRAEHFSAQSAAARLREAYRSVL